MKRIASLMGVVCALCAPPVQAQEFDFTPRYMLYQMEGVSEERPYFSQGNFRWVFFMPDVFQLRGDSAEAVFSLKDSSTSVLQISKSPLTPKTELTIPNFALYRAEAEKLFGPGASDIRLLGERISPYSINDWESHEFTFALMLDGEELKRAIAFLNFNDEQQWVITITSPEDDFQKMHDLAGMILNSLLPVPDTAEEAVSGN